MNPGTWRDWLPFPPNLSEHGPGVDQLNIYVHYLMFVMFIAWAIYFVYCLIHFRKREGHKAVYNPAKGKLAKVSEVGVILAEAILLVALSMPAWAAYKKNFPSREEALNVRVVGEQFAWNFHYPGRDGVFGKTDPKLMNNVGNSLGIDMSDPRAKDDIITLNELHIPLNKPVIVNISSKDVIHSFTINVLRVKQDAVPGMVIPIHFKAVSGVGTHEITCAQLCGLGHYRMQGFVYIDTPEQYAQWFAQKESELQGASQ
jgi:cytochrome c oxidase subunit II